MGGGGGGEEEEESNSLCWGFDRREERSRPTLGVSGVASRGGAGGLAPALPVPVPLAPPVPVLPPLSARRRVLAENATLLLLFELPELGERGVSSAPAAETKPEELIAPDSWY